MDYRRFDNDYYIRLDKDDEVISSLAAVCEKENITAGSVKGIGGCQEATVGVFDLDKKTYNEEKVSAMLEMISLDGNVTTYEGKPYLHLHATFAYQKDASTQVLTGHLLSAVIGLTGEIVLSPADGHITRKYIEELGIRIWDFD